MAKWIKTSKPGIRYREHATRKHGIHPDRYYVFNYRIGKDLVEGALGWASEGWTQERAAEERNKLKKSAKRGGPRTLTEMRKLADERKISLGGCVVRNDSPSYICDRCHKKWL